MRCGMHSMPAIEALAQTHFDCQDGQLLDSCYCMPDTIELLTREVLGLVLGVGKGPALMELCLPSVGEICSRCLCLGAVM